MFPRHVPYVLKPLRKMRSDQLALARGAHPGGSSGDQSAAGIPVRRQSGRSHAARTPRCRGAARRPPRTPWGTPARWVRIQRCQLLEGTHDPRADGGAGLLSGQSLAVHRRFGISLPVRCWLPPAGLSALFTGCGKCTRLLFKPDGMFRRLRTAAYSRARIATLRHFCRFRLP